MNKQKIIIVAGGLLFLFIFMAALFYSWPSSRSISSPPDIDIPEKNSPEEVYQNFRSSLLKGEYGGALRMIREDRRPFYEKAFIDKGVARAWAKKLPAEIKLMERRGNFSFFEIDYGTGRNNTATFIKDDRGFWEIDSL